MSLSVGIVGLPNVGKSTLFNALLRRQQALAANYPFATIDPNTGIVEVPDDRLIKLAETVKVSEKLDKLPPLTHATIEFVDIAGIVEGASKGEGLGNKFLAHIREVDLVCHVLRAFTDENVILTGKLDPKEDLKTIRTELALKDLETLEKQVAQIRKNNNSKIKAAYESVLESLNNSKPINIDHSDEETSKWFRELHLLSAKPEIFVINASENQVTDPSFKTKLVNDIEVAEKDVVVICAQIESELSSLNEDDQKTYLTDLGISESGIEKMARVSYTKLDLISFLTAGEIEARAWTVRKGSTAPTASGVIHTDFAKKFIKADVINWQDFIDCGGWKNAREKGKVRIEGKEYVMKDGDVVDFKIGA